MIWPIMVFADKSRVGKDYAANKIVQVFAQQNVAAKHFSIASPLKQLCYKYFSTLPPKQYEIDSELRKYRIVGLNVENVVELWIKVGECFRDIKPTVWIEECLGQIMQDSRGGELFIPVISDYRFDCEYDFLNQVFAKCVSTLKVNSDKGVVNKSDGKVTQPPDYSVINYFDESFDKTLEVFCEEFMKNMGR